MSEQNYYLFGIQIFFLARHMFRQSKDSHLLRDSRSYYLFEAVLCMAAKLPRMTVMGEGHDAFTPTWHIQKREPYISVSKP